MVVSARIVNAVVVFMLSYVRTLQNFFEVNCPIETSELIFRTRRYSIFTPVVCIRNHEYLKPVVLVGTASQRPTKMPVR